MSEEIRFWTDEEIVEYLRKFLNTSLITVDDLKCPQPSFVTAVFRSFLNTYQVNLESLPIIPFDISNVLDNSIEWAEDTVYFTTFKLLMGYIMPFSGIVDVSIKDFLEPKPKRTRKILICLIQLLRHFVVKASMYEQMATQCQEETNRKQDILNRLNLIRQEIAETRAGIEKKQGLDIVNKEYQAELEKETIAKDALSADYQKLKTKQADSVKRLCELDVDMESLKVKLEELDQKIMKSPDRLDSEMEQLKQKILEIMIKSKEEQANNAKKKKVIGNLSDGYDLATETCKTVNTICSVGEQLHELATAVTSDQVKFKKVQEDVKRMKYEIEKEEGQKCLCEQWIAKENMNSKKQIEAIEEIMLINNEEQQKLDSTCENYQKELAVYEEVSKALEQKLADEKIQSEIYSNKVHGELHLFEKKFLDYNDGYRKSLKSMVEEGLDPDVLAKVKKLAGQP